MKKLMLIISSILLVFGSYIYLTNGSLFLFYGDNVEQLIPFYNHLTNLIRSGSLNFWDPSVGFGSNLFVFFFNAPLGSPFLYLLLFFEPKFIPYSFLFTLLIRLFLTSIFAYLWIGKLTKKESTRLILSLAFTFSGWAMYWIHYNTTLDFYMYVPLILYLSEEVLENRKRLLFVICVGLAAISSLYYFYIFAWLLFIYHSLRHITSSQKASLKTYFQAFMKLLPWFILGITLVSFIIFPNIAIILSSPRFSGAQDALFLVDVSFIRIYSFLTAFFSPVLSDYDTNIFASRVLDNQVFLNYYYSFLIFPLVLPLFFFINNKKKWIYIITILLFYFSSFIPFFSVLFNGNSDRRWQLILLIINIVSVAYILEHSFSRTQVIISFMVTTGILYVLTTISLSNKLFIQENLMTMKQIVYGSIVILGLYAFVLLEIKYKYIPLVLVLVFESLFSLYTRTHINNSPRYIAYDQFNFDAYYNDDIYDYIQSFDSETFRIEMSQTIANDPINYSYTGVTFYSSVYNHSTRPILDNRFTPGWNSGYAPSKFLFKQLLNTKYFVTSTDVTPPYGYEFLKMYKNYKIYKSTLDIGIGFATPNIINSIDFNELNKIEQDLVLYQAIVSDHQTTVTDLFYGFPLIRNSVNPQAFLQKEDGYIFIDYSRSNPYTECLIDFYAGDSLLKQVYRHEYGYTAVKNSLNHDIAFFYCRFIYNINEAIPVDINFVSNRKIDLLYQKVNDYDSFTNVKFNNSRLTADIHISSDNSLVFLNIPFDKGWKLKVDNIERDVEIVNQAFIGFMLDRGGHMIELTYPLPLIKEGLILSGVSLILLIYLQMKNPGFLKSKF